MKRRTRIGGQALMEGVMMRGSASMAMAVRAPDGSIMLETERLKGRKWYNKVPIVRGVVSFVSSLIGGMRTLMRSAEISSPEEETPGKGWMAFAVILGVVLAVGLFILLPGFLNDLILGRLVKLGEHVGPKTKILLESLFEGVLRILIFVLYLFIVSRMRDIRRTFMYHGAEHRTINCYEKGYEMTVENVQKCSTRHNRCGTTFLFFVMIVSILVFALVRWALSYIPLGAGSWSDNRWILTAARLVMLPLVAGLSFELLQGLAKLPDNGFTNILRAPGLALQRLTTYPPADEMAEVALKSFLAVLAMDEDPAIQPVRFGEHRIPDVRRELRTGLVAYGLDEREADAETDWILCHAATVRRNELASMRLLPHAAYGTAVQILSRRISGEPLDYILGESEFFGNKIKVTTSVLIPRMETEVLADEAIRRIGERELSVLDLCTGSGCIALAVAKNTRACVTASDLSDSALAVARENLAGTDVKTVQSDLFASVEGTFDMIVSNPPYIRSAEIPALASEVRCQPAIALDGGADGMAIYRRIESEYREKLNEGGILLMEIGHDQAEEIRNLFGAHATVEIIKDLDGNNRVAVIVPKG
ncbi:MAG: peptide chain release factor N(5)-glutamine methyltransferase [Clostridia bacterium]|nr:peptide chain release factor N(5)-glutamine methyltransferase [Clostridia bacterium]